MVNDIPKRGRKTKRIRVSEPSRLGSFLAMLGTFGLLVAAVALPQNERSLPTATKEQAVFFESKIRPIFANNCFACHAGKAHSSGLRLDSATAVAKGGDMGAVVVPGDPGKSSLVRAIHQTGTLKMPPTGKKLSDAEIADIETWIKMGAPWPAERIKSKDDSESWWSLEPVKTPVYPKVRDRSWVYNPIDLFVKARLEAKGILPAHVADRRNLIRRLTYDLTGLPPTPSEVEAFLLDKSNKAYEKVVDRLLTSPRYGEKWARNWMDVARYADTKGYVFEEDRNYYNAYTYRNWLINAFNSDLSYDQFILDQLAADRVQVQSEDKRPLAAMGFLTLGRRFINSVPDIIDDRIDVTMRGFQGLTVACARCHNHKFDPIPTQDYYSLYAVFNSSDEEAVPISDKAITDPWQRHNQKITQLNGQIRQISTEETKTLRATLKDPSKGTEVSAAIRQTLQGIREDQVPQGAELKKLIPAFQPTARESLTKMLAELDVVSKEPVTLPQFAMAMKDRSTCSDGVVFKRGNPGNPGESAPRRFLLALSKKDVERAHWTSGSGRLELAQQIASKENPLTARVFVNRLWQSHFGTGIVRTPSDYGHHGDLPTDQGLLDYLAWAFMDGNWSVKKLQKLIVMSSTYRQSTTYSKQTYSADPDNRYWDRMNRHRLTLEELRDTFVKASGHLDDHSVGGKSVDLWARPFSTRRALYGFIERQNLPGIFRTFDFASPDSHSSRRFQTTVPQQALFFMNSPFAVDQARELTSQAEIQGARDSAQCVRRLYLFLFQRLPDANELQMGLSYLGTNRNSSVEAPADAWKYGYGAFDQTLNKVTGFTSLSYFPDMNYRVGKSFPDPNLGYLTLNNVGGHPGHDPGHAVIRRWTAPNSLKIRISGKLIHGQKEGDGVRARVVSNRKGLLGQWQAHNGQAQTDVVEIAVQKGEVLDFIVDPIESDGFDSFQWVPNVNTIDKTQVWDSSAGFGPPPEAELTRLTLYAQALMMTNEFMFVD